MRRAAEAFLAVAIMISLEFAAVAFASSAHAAEMTGPSPTSSAGHSQFGVSLTSVTTLSVPEFAGSATICVEGAAARYTDDGTTPSATIGIPVAAGQCFDFAGPLVALRIIGAGATLDASFYR